MLAHNITVKSYGGIVLIIFCFSLPLKMFLLKQG